MCEQLILPLPSCTTLYCQLYSFGHALYQQLQLFACLYI